DNFNIILFLCNWGPHAAFQAFQEKGLKIHPEVRMIRIPCTGRISKALLFKAFEKGADGVALVGCKPGTCRNGRGTDSANENTEDIRDILELLGMSKERMCLATFLPEETEAFHGFLENFCENIKKIGKSPITPDRVQETGTFQKKSLPEIVASYDAFACQDCGKCTSSCPLALSGKEYSPRTLVNSLVTGNFDPEHKDIWSCLTCGICYERCPSNVNFPEFICDIRCNLTGSDNSKRHQAHGGFFQSLMRSMASSDLKPDRWKWLPDNISTDSDSKILFYGGCSPYFDIFFRNHHGVKTSDILADSLRLLNFFDIKPRILDNERCCGHDLLWSGDKENFLKLAKLNIDLIRNAGIEEVITSCPECYKTMLHDYPKYGITPDFKITHIYEFLEKQIDEGAVAFNKLESNITYQDSCRLNRLDGMKDFPRKLINRLLPEKFEEMKESRNSALCCGNCAWTGCDSFSKALQVKRIRQAHSTGSNLLVTSCPKCQIHLRCAMDDPFLGGELEIEMADLTGVIAKTICWE
ncbi:MAG: hydrogenase iron-sulfur subunit, partial [Desulfobacteraceae bacterium]|nr:hydrogenase iron-sulfur subunit [Desulfobacteraceae bacterium]